jgi:uncharacterized protein
MDYLLIILSLICVLIGLIGSIIPILPGPPISWIGILLLYFTSIIDFNYWILSITFLMAIASLFFDWIIPAKLIKKFNGTNYGVYGAIIGSIAGLIYGSAFGFIIGLLVGSFIGELIYDSKDLKRAIIATIGSFIGFILSTAINFTIALCMLLIVLKILWDNSAKLF